MNVIVGGRAVMGGRMGRGTPILKGLGGNWERE